jgi:hypothetical protein
MARIRPSHLCPTAPSVSVTPVSDASQEEAEVATDDRPEAAVSGKDDAPPTFNRADYGSATSQRPQRQRRPNPRYADSCYCSALRSSPESEDEPHADEQEPEPATEEEEDDSAAVRTPSLKRKRPATLSKSASKSRSKKPKKTTRKAPAKRASKAAVKPRDAEQEDEQRPAVSTPHTDKRTSGETAYGTPPSSSEKANKVPSTPDSPSERQQLLRAREDGSQPVRRRTRNSTSTNTRAQQQPVLETTEAAATPENQTKIVKLRVRVPPSVFQDPAQQTLSPYNGAAGGTEADVTSTPPSTPPTRETVCYGGICTHVCHHANLIVGH